MQEGSPTLRLLVLGKAVPREDPIVRSAERPISGSCDPTFAVMVLLRADIVKGYVSVTDGRPSSCMARQDDAERSNPTFSPLMAFDREKAMAAGYYDKMIQSRVSITLRVI